MPSVFMTVTGKQAINGFFNRRDGELYAEEVPVSRIVAQYDSPCYIYSRATLERHFRAYDQALGALPHRICYAVKANGNLAVLNVLARLGAGFDIVSGGELERVIRAGGDPGNTVFPVSGSSAGNLSVRWKRGVLLQRGVGSGTRSAQRRGRRAGPSGAGITAG